MTPERLFVLASFTGLAIFAYWTLRSPGGRLGYAFEHPRTSLLVGIGSMVGILGYAAADGYRDVAPAFRSEFGQYLVRVGATAFCLGALDLGVEFRRRPRGARDYAAWLRAWGSTRMFVLAIALFIVMAVAIQLFNPVPSAPMEVSVVVGLLGFLAPWIIFGVVRVFLLRSELPSGSTVAAALAEDRTNPTSDERNA